VLNRIKRYVGLEIYKLISILIQNSKDKITVVNRVIRQES